VTLTKSNITDSMIVTATVTELFLTSWRRHDDEILNSGCLLLSEISR